MARRNSKDNTSSQIYLAVRDDIANGKYPGGTFLVEATLCEEFNVSRTPVREALIRLANDRFIELIPNRGAFVPHFTMKDIMELYQIRVAADGMAAYLTVKRQDQDLLAQLEASTRREAELLAQDPPPIKEISEEDVVFHSLLVHGCGNERLIETIELAENQMKRIMRLSADRYALEALTVSLDFHQKVVAAFRANDCNPARRLIEDHWSNNLNGYILRDLAGTLPLDL